MGNVISKIIYGGGLIFDLAKWVIVVVLAIVLVNSFWLSIFVVDGASMEPSLHDGEVVLMSKSYLRGSVKPERGDSVVVGYPGDPENKRYVKRVIGMPGETIQLKNGRVYINNMLLRESYIPSDFSTLPDGKWDLATSQYFLMGDNRENSNDSRYFGAVEERFFIGKAINVVLPALRAIINPNYNLGYAAVSAPAAQE